MPSNHVSISVAQKLHEAGYRSECEYEYLEPKIARSGGILKGPFIVRNDDTHVPENKYFPAPSAAQLADELPNVHVTNDPEHPLHQLIIEKQNTQYLVTYVCINCMGKLYPQTATTLPDALGLMMCYLLENKLI